MNTSKPWIPRGMTSLNIKNCLEDCRTGIETLRKKGTTNRVTTRLLQKRVRALQDEWRTVTQPNDAWKEEFANDVLLYREAVTQILQYKRQKWATFSEFFGEMSRRLFGYRESLDFFVVESPIKVGSLRCDFQNGPYETSFILFVSPLWDCQEKDYLGLVAHEIAHMYPKVFTFADSYSPRRKKKGEALADFLGLNLIGPAFALTVTCYIIDIVGAADFRSASKTHPSWACRSSLLRNANKDLWENTTIENWIELHLSRVDDFGMTISPLENMLHLRCLREMDGLREDFGSFKMSEGGLMSIAENNPSDMSNITLALNAHARKKVTL